MILGGILLLRYLYLIEKPSLFLGSIGSANGLLAVSLAGAVVLLIFGFVFYFPILLAGYALHECHGGYLFFKLLLLFVGFWGVVIFLPVSGLLSNFTRPEITYIEAIILFIGVIFFLFSYTKYNFKTAIKEGFIIRVLALWGAVLITAFPMLFVIKNIDLKLEDYEIVFVLLLYLFVVVAFSIAHSQAEDWRFGATLVLFFMILITLYSSLPWLVTAKLVGIRNELKEWYWSEDAKKILSVLPPQITKLVVGKGVYIYAATAFAYMDTKVICANIADSDPWENDISARRQIDLKQCVILDKSEIRLSGQYPNICSLK